MMSSGPASRKRQPAMLGGAALLRIELVEQRRGHGLRISEGSDPD